MERSLLSLLATTACAFNLCAAPKVVVVDRVIERFESQIRGAIIAHPDDLALIFQPLTAGHPLSMCASCPFHHGGGTRMIGHHRLGDLADDLAGKVTIEPGDQGGWNDAAGLDLIGRDRFSQIDVSIH